MNTPEIQRYPKQYDVVVVGGGPSGVGAAVASARNGAKTALIERYGILGGMLTSGYVNPFLGAVAPGTMVDELSRLLDVSIHKTRNGEEKSINTERAKYTLLKFVADAGVDIFLQTPVVEVICQEKQVHGVVISTQNGLSALEAKVVIDATGDGFVAARAGAQFCIGRECDEKCQPTSLEFTIDQVDESRAITCWGGTDPVTMPDGEKYSSFCRRMHDSGVLPQNVAIVRLHRTNHPGERSVNATQANGYDTLTPEGIMGAEMELRGQIDSVVRFLQTYVPGYENCKLMGSGSTLGVRETRRIIGDYVLCDEDVETGARKQDVVVHNAWFLIDIHNPTGGGQAEGHSQPAIPYDIPYRSLLPKGVEQILTCGRCISGTHRAHASYRVMAICIATGQAAGTAAACSIARGVSPRALSISDLQNALMQQGCVLFEEGENHT